MDEGNSNQILIAVTQLQTQMRTVSDQLKEISKIGQTVVEVVESSKQAHRRLDDIKTEVEKSLNEHKEKFNKDLETQKLDAEKALAAQKLDYSEKVASEAKTRQEDDAAEIKAREKIESNQTWLVRAFGIAAIGWIIEFFTNLGG